MLIITNPVNSTVPIARKIFQEAGCYDAARLFGVTTLDVCRANTFVAEKMGVPTENVHTPVVGGHAGATILPLLSQCSHKILDKLGDEAAIAELTTRIQVRTPPLLCCPMPRGVRRRESLLSGVHRELRSAPRPSTRACVHACAMATNGVRSHLHVRVNPMYVLDPTAVPSMQNAGTEVVEAKAGAGSATLSMAYAAYVFAQACMKAMNGFAGIVECAYVEDESVDGCDFFAQRVKLGKSGVVERFGVGKLNESEAAQLEAMKEQLAAEIQKGVEWSKPAPPS